MEGTMETAVLPRKIPPSAGAPVWSPRKFSAAWKAARERKVRVMDLASAAGVLPATLYKWRSGASEPNINQASALARILKVSLDSLLE